MEMNRRSFLSGITSVIAAFALPFRMFARPKSLLSLAEDPSVIGWRYIPFSDGRPCPKCQAWAYEGGEDTQVGFYARVDIPCKACSNTCLVGPIDHRFDGLDDNGSPKFTPLYRHPKGTIGEFVGGRFDPASERIQEFYRRYPRKFAVAETPRLPFVVTRG